MSFHINIDKSLKLADKAHRKMRCSAGFTLVEVLVTTLILVLATGIVATGVTVARKSYEQEQFESQANVLASTVNLALADPFRFMQMDTSSGSPVYKISFNQDSSARQPNILNPSLTTDENGRFLLSGTDSSTGKPVQVPLLNDGAYGNCKIAIVPGDDAYLDINSSSASVSFRVTSSTNPNLYHDYQMTYKPNVGVTRTSRDH